MAQYQRLKAEAGDALAVLPDGRFLRTVLRRRQGRRSLPRHRADQARGERRRTDPDVRRAGPFGGRLSRPADQGRQSGGDRRADRKPGRSPQGARVEGLGRPRHRPAGDPRNADRGRAARRRASPTGSPRSAARARIWAIAAADISTGRFELVGCGPGELAAELARLSPAEVDRRRTVAGISTHAGKGGFDSAVGRTGAQGALRPRQLDGLAIAVARANWPRPAGCSPISTRPRRAPRACSMRRGGSRDRAMWRSTRRPAKAWS